MAEPVHGGMMGEPDLSHLTEEERQIIQNVMMRQKHEEEKENEIMRRKQDEVKVLEESIRVRSERQRKAGIELDATCQICLKTKFADGIGHMCNYCAVRCCARCGGKVTLRSNKVIWVCILCRKKQELLIKTGQWIHSGMVPTGEGIMLRPEDLGFVPGPSLDKRPKLERGSSYELPPVIRRQEERMMRPPPIRARSFDSADERPPGDPFHMGPRGDWGRTRIEPPPPQQPLGRMPPMYPPQQELEFHERMRHGSEYGEERDVVRDLQDPQHLDTAGGMMMRSGRQKMEAVGRNDSLSSDQSESIGPPPPKPHKHKRNKKPRQQSLSSSDDEVRSTPDCTSCEDQELESESVSEKGEGETVAERRKKEEILDAKIKKFLAHPVSWAPSKDGGKMIGHMILNKDQGGGAPSSSSATILGLKVTGGKILQFGKLGAIIEKVKKGSIADTVGRLKPGDEVIEWHGRSLAGKTFEEVYDIIAESRQEPQVELIVSRPISELGRRDTATRRHTHGGVSQCEPIDPRKLSEGGRFEHRDRRPSVTITSPSSPDTMRGRPHSPHSGGRVQLKLWYDSSSAQLVVTVVGAVDLPPRPNGQARNPYAKMLLLPDLSEKSKRRTKTLANTLDPKWRQNIVYSALRRIDLKNRSLSVTVWDYDRYAKSDFLGEAIIDLAAAPMDNETYSYQLVTTHEEAAISTSSKRGMFMDVEQCSVASTDHLSPPSTTSRLSDSDISDYDDRPLRVTDGASISSVGSSCSPPPDVESIERQSRRDTDSSPQGRRRSSMMLRTDPRRREIDPGRSSRQRSHSAAPLDSPHDHGHVSRSRSKSPRRSHDQSRSLSPPEARRSPLEGRGAGGGRARSETGTPLGSPKKRQLPQIPMMDSRDRHSHDMGDRRLRHRMDSYQQRPYQPQSDHGIGKLFKKLRPFSLSHIKEQRKNRKLKKKEKSQNKETKEQKKEKRKEKKAKKKEEKKAKKQKKKKGKKKKKEEETDEEETDGCDEEEEEEKEETDSDQSSSESYASSSDSSSTPYGEGSGRGWRSRGATSRPVRSPEREGLEFGDSDIESVISATSALSTQSERVRSSRRIGSEFVHKPEGGFDDGRRPGHLGGSYSGEITVDDKADSTDSRGEESSRSANLPPGQLYY